MSSMVAAFDVIAQEVKAAAKAGLRNSVQVDQTGGYDDERGKAILVSHAWKSPSAAPDNTLGILRPGHLDGVWSEFCHRGRFSIMAWIGIIKDCRVYMPEDTLQESGQFCWDDRNDTG